MDQALFITGGTGFIGSKVIDEAMKSGREVIALTLEHSSDLEQRFPGVKFIVGDLTTDPLELGDMNIGTVIHLAASMTGSADEQFRSTVTGTDNLLNAMRHAGIKRLIGISSISVLDYRSINAGSTIDESLHLSDDIEVMGIYAQTKLAQEKLFQQFGAEAGQQCIILRPGLVYDDQQLMAAHAGIIKGPIKLLASHTGQVPAIHVISLADAINKAFEADIPASITLQLVDDNLPTQRRYLQTLKQRNELSGGIALPWKLLSLLSSIAFGLLKPLGLNSKLPEVLLPQSFAARLRPYQFSNTRAKAVLHWKPNDHFA